MERGDKMMGSRKGHRRGGIDMNKNCYLIVWAISEIPGLSRATPKRHPRGTLSPQGPLDAHGIFCIFSTKRGPVPKLTPVRSQVVGLRLATLEAGDSVCRHNPVAPT